MANLSAAEIRKYDWRPAVFIKKLKEKSPFEVTGGKKVVLIMMKDVDRILEKGSNKELNELRFTDGKGGTYKLSDFVKNKDFGGKGEGASTVKEDMALNSLRAQIDAAKVREGTATIKIKVGNKTYDVFDAASTFGTPKSDFHLIDQDGKEIVWISHKDGKTERNFQQWGGVSQRVEPKIYSHREVQAFAKDLKGLFPTGITAATTVARKIEDKNLKQLSVYGSDFGGPEGRQNVSLMLQGKIELKKKGTSYEIDGYHTHLNGDDMTAGYEPVLMAIYKGDRSDLGIKGARVVIAPIGSRRISYQV